MSDGGSDDIDEMLEEPYKEKSLEKDSSKRSKRSKSERKRSRSRSKKRTKTRSRSPRDSRDHREHKERRRKERHPASLSKLTAIAANAKERSRSKSKERRKSDSSRSRDEDRSSRYRGGGSTTYYDDRPYGGRSSYGGSSGYYYSEPSWRRGGGGAGVGVGGAPPPFGGRGGRVSPTSGRRVPGPERRDVMPFTPRLTPPKHALRIEDMTPDERDARTIFVMQLSARCKPRDLEDFFSSVGQVRDVRIITDSKTKRSKGIAYIEFYDMDAVPLALGLNGQRLLGAPLMIQPTQSEKNRLANSLASFVSLNQAMQPSGPMKLYIGSLHFNITEEMLQGIFGPFGKIDSIQLLKDAETGRSRGYGFITFRNADDAKKAMEQLNGFELAGRPMRVGHVTEHMPQSAQNLDSDELDRSGVDLGTTGRLQLMAKLAQSSGMELPHMAQQMLQKTQMGAQANSTPPIATQCFMLSNMFDPTQECNSNWDVEIRDDVIEECNKHGGVFHIFVDKASPQGNVYVKCPSVASAVASVNSLHGRWFAGKIITANYVPVTNYHELFPDALHSPMLLVPSYKQSGAPPPAGLSQTQFQGY